MTLAIWTTIALLHIRRAGRLSLTLAGLCVLHLLSGAGPVYAATYYVSPNGDDTTGLAESSAFRTLRQAADKTLPGDTVLVMDGDYANASRESVIVSITRSGSASGGYITYKAYPGHKPRLVVAANNWAGFKVRASYIVIEGFTVDGNAENITYDFAYSQRDIANPATNADCINVDGRPIGVTLHHLIFRNNTVFECPGAGIVAIASDYVTIDNNVVHSTSWWTKYGTSGISVYDARHVDMVQSYKIFVRRNRSYNNENYIPWQMAGRRTDGNGIIIDDNKNIQQNGVLAYVGRTLVENNLVYNNGARGIAVYSSSHVDVVNNTAYQNARSADINSDVMCSNNDDVRYLNNVIFARSNKTILSISSCTSATFDYNLYFNGTVEFLGTHDIVADPRFANASLDPAEADFTLSPASPAIDSGTEVLAPLLDIFGNGRPEGMGYDRGAYEASGPDQPDYTVSVSADPPAGGVVGGGGFVTAGSMHAVEASPNSGYAFVNWTEEGTQVSAASRYTFTVSADRIFVAHFEQDADGDSVPDSMDNCPAGENPNQVNTDGDSQGDACDADDDNDNHLDTADNCPLVPNPDQANANPSDGVGDACDDRWIVSLSSNPSSGGTLSGAGSNIADGTPRTITATAKAGYEFARWLENGALVTKQRSYTFTLTKNRALVAQFRVLRRRNDLLVDLGAEGLWRFLNNSTWRKLDARSPVAIAAADLDGNGRDEVIASFSVAGFRGLFARYNGSRSWIRLDNGVPTKLAVGDLDGNGKDDIVAEFGQGRLRVLRNNARPFTSVWLGAAQTFAVGDLDGNGQDDLLVDHSSGLYVLNNNGRKWKRLSSSSPTTLVAGDFDGDGRDEVAVGLGRRGIFLRSNNTGTFRRVSGGLAEALTVGDLDGNGPDGNGREELLADMGRWGLYARYNSGRWLRLHRANPNGILALDMSERAIAEVVISRGPSGIFVRYNNSGPFIRRNMFGSQAMTAGAFD